MIFEPEVETLASERLRALQTERLRALIAYVKEHVPLYEERLADVKPARISDIDDLGLGFHAGCLALNLYERLIVCRQTAAAGARLTTYRAGCPSGVLLHALPRLWRIDRALDDRSTRV